MNRCKATALVWFRAENFDRLVAMFEDGRRTHRNYSEWLRAAHAERRLAQAKGEAVVCVDFDPDDFLAWCDVNGLKTDATGRSACASAMALKILNSSGSSQQIH